MLRSIYDMSAVAKPVGESLAVGMTDILCCCSEHAVSSLMIGLYAF